MDFLVQAIADRYSMNKKFMRFTAAWKKCYLKLSKKEDYSEEFKQVSDVYGEDIDISRFQTQLCVLTTNLPEDVYNNILSLISHLQKMSPAEKELSCEVIHLMKIMLIMPGTNAFSERSFSALRQLETYLRSTMMQQRLNNLLILHEHKDCTDKIKILAMMIEFISKDEH